MITRKDIYEALGAETDDKFMTGMLVGIGVGAVVGSALAVLFAPKAGVEIRHMLGERGSELIDKAKTRVGIGQSQGQGKNGGEAQPGGEPIR